MLIDLMFMRIPTIKLNVRVAKLFSELCSDVHPYLLSGVKELVKIARGVNSYDKNTSEKLLLSFNVSFLNIIADRMTEMELKSFGIFVDFLISSLHSNKHSVESQYLCHCLECHCILLRVLRRY